MGIVLPLGRFFLSGVSEMASGIVLLTNGTISSPVSQLDLLLPSGYADFEIRLIGFQVNESGEDSLQFRLSFDGGLTFSEESVYSTRYLESDSAIGSVYSSTSNGTSGQISNGYPSQVQTPGQSFNGTI